jgi:hypothetical protein
MSINKTIKNLKDWPDDTKFTVGWQYFFPHKNVKVATMAVTNVIKALQTFPYRNDDKLMISSVSPGAGPIEIYIEYKDGMSWEINEERNSMNLSEGLNHKDMVGLIKPTVHIDEFVSKMGNDDDIATVSFYTKNSKVADDLVEWFEKGYDFVLDADRSPGEIKPNRYLVYVEIKRRSSLPKQIEELVKDLASLTEYEASDWTVKYDDSEMDFDVDYLESRLLLSPRDYRINKEADINAMRESAGIKTVPIYDTTDRETLLIQQQAGIR